MKNSSFIGIIICIIFTNCQAQKNIKYYYLKLTPIGISDFPRDTLFISMKKIIGVTNTNSSKYLGLINQTVTDEKSLSRIVLFVNKNAPPSNPSNKEFQEYGCFNISLYDKDLLNTNYKLNRIDSKKYLNALTDMLEKNNLDKKVIKELKERCLMPIDY